MLGPKVKITLLRPWLAQVNFSGPWENTYIMVVFVITS